jgi:hypothetical protein
MPPNIRAIIEGNVPAEYTVAQYIADIRAIRSTGSATAETSFYPPLDRLFNAAGETLKPAVLFSTQVRNSGAGIPDGGFFPQPKRQRRGAEPELLQNPERGVVEIKPADYSLDALAAEPQTIGSPHSTPSKGLCRNPSMPILNRALGGLPKRSFTLAAPVV